MAKQSAFPVLAMKPNRIDFIRTPVLAIDGKVKIMGRAVDTTEITPNGHLWNSGFQILLCVELGRCGALVILAGVYFIYIAA